MKFQVQMGDSRSMAKFHAESPQGPKLYFLNLAIYKREKFNIKWRRE